MKKNHIVLKRAALAAIAVVAISFIGCTTDENPGPTDDRDKYVGTWSCTELDASNVQSTFTVNISKKTSDSTRIYIGNIGNIGSAYKPEAVVSGNTFSIPSYNSQGYTVSGSGSYSSSSGKINMNYTVNDGNGSDAFTAVLTK